MKIARYVHQDNIRYGIVDEEELVELSGDPMISGYEPTGNRVALSDVRLIAPVIPRSKVVCVGLNYAAHSAELAGSAIVPDNPLIFLKPNTAVIGPDEPILIPPVDGRITHEGELAIVIGKFAKQVKAADAFDYIFGYTIGNDVSARDVQWADGQWARAKGYDTFCPLGPWIETELDPTNLEIKTFVDGELRRQGNTRDMVHNIAEIIEFASDVWTLFPGDVILTGTPAGLGGFLDGQTIDIEIEGIGTLSNPAQNRD